MICLGRKCCFQEISYAGNHQLASSYSFHFYEENHMVLLSKFKLKDFERTRLFYNLSSSFSEEWKPDLWNVSLESSIGFWTIFTIRPKLQSKLQLKATSLPSRTSNCSFGVINWIREIPRSQSV